MFLDSVSNTNAADRWRLVAEMAMRPRDPANRPQPAGQGGGQGGGAGEGQQGGYSRAPSMREVRSGESALMKGHQGQSVRQLQTELNRRGAGLAVDGKFGPLTERAVQDLQGRAGVQADGKFGRESAQALRSTPPGRSDSYNRTHAPGSSDPRRPDGSPQPPPRAPSVADRPPDGSTPASRLVRTDEDRRGVRRADSTNPRPTQPGAPPNRSATFDRVTRNAGQRNQMVEGRVTVNGNTYDFRSGGSRNGNLPPGDYTVTPHRWSRPDPSMNVGGVGYSFALSDKYDPRVGQNRSLLRIHPDGRGPGTEGCMGIVGNADVQRRFREDMRAELARNNGRFTLSIR